MESLSKFDFFFNKLYNILKAYLFLAQIILIVLATKNQN